MLASYSNKIVGRNPENKTNGFHGQVLGKIFYDTQNLYDWKYIPFWMMKWINVDVNGIYQVIVNKFDMFEGIYQV